MYHACCSFPVFSAGFLADQDQLGGPQIMVPNGVTHQVQIRGVDGLSCVDPEPFVPPT